MTEPKTEALHGVPVQRHWYYQDFDGMGHPVGELTFCPVQDVARIVELPPGSPPPLNPQEANA